MDGLTTVTRAYWHGQTFDLLLAWSGRIIRARYQQSILGGAWAIIQPAATVAIFSVVFTRVIRVDTGGLPYVLFSFVAMVPWTLFSAGLTDMVSSLVDNMNLVTKIYFPREILPVAALVARLLDFAIAVVVVLALILFLGHSFYPSGWLWLPLILLIQLALTLGIGLAGAALNVFYRDIKHLVALGLQLWMYASPVIYPSSLVPSEYRSLYFANPMAGIVEAYRATLLYGRSPDWSLYLAGGISLVLLVAGYWFFKRVEFEFADIV